MLPLELLEHLPDVALVFCGAIGFDFVSHHDPFHDLPPFSNSDLWLRRLRQTKGCGATAKNKSALARIERLFGCRRVTVTMRRAPLRVLDHFENNELSSWPDAA